MELQLTSNKLRALPVQVIEIDDGVLLKRSCTEIKIMGEGALNVIGAILDASGGEGIEREELLDLFGPAARPEIEMLVDQLVQRRLILAGDEADTLHRNGIESSQEVFYWNFGRAETEVVEQIDKRRIVIVGVNDISHRIAASFERSGFGNFEVVDYPLLRNIRMFDDDGNLRSDGWSLPEKEPIPYGEWASGLDPESFDCLVATSDFGGLQLMRQWNAFCVANNRHFFPVVLQNLIGYIGPLVVPGQTACFECLRARQNSNMDDANVRRLAEPWAYEGQRVNGFHPSMASILGDIAAVELGKMYGGWLRSRSIGTLIEVNLIATLLETRKVLRVPRCSVCSRLQWQSSTSPEKNIFMPGHSNHP
jgi:bacteriocin biosynthesis cyclodehydratase domain-containing protein